MAFINTFGPPKVKGKLKEDRLRDMEKVGHKLFLQQGTPSHTGPVSKQSQEFCLLLGAHFLNAPGATVPGVSAWSCKAAGGRLPASQDGSACRKTHTEGICPPRRPALIFFPVPHPADPRFWHQAAKTNTLKATLGIIKND